MPKKNIGNERSDFLIRSVEPADREWIVLFTKEHWGSDFVVARGAVFHPRELPGFVARDSSGVKIGLVTYSIEGDACEIVTLNSIRENTGVGSTLLKAVHGVAEEAGCRRIRLITTNDNLRALGFYRKRGYRVAAVHPDAVGRSRELKPEIPLASPEGIPIRDEIELEFPIERPG